MGSSILIVASLTPAGSQKESPLARASFRLAGSKPDQKLVERSGIEPLLWLGFNHDLSFTGLTPLEKVRRSGGNPTRASWL